MSETLVFMMGEFEAQFPTDRQYAKNHMWAQQQSSRWRFGFAAYAVRLLQDVYFLDWDVDSDTQLETGQEIGQIESSKAESVLFAPLPGRLAEFNQVLLSDPSAINADKYGGGWLFEMDGDGEDLMTATAYLQHLETVWEVTQKTIKGQLNQ